MAVSRLKLTQHGDVDLVDVEGTKVVLIPEDFAALAERFRAALMVEHADDWDMETISEAAHICARQIVRAAP